MGTKMRHLISGHVFAQHLDGHVFWKAIVDGARRHEKETISTAARDKMSVATAKAEVSISSRPHGEHALPDSRQR